MRTLLPRLYQLFSHEDRLLILIDADPDSIASALALKRLLWRRCPILRHLPYPAHHPAPERTPGAAAGNQPHSLRRDQPRGLQPQGPGGQPAGASSAVRGPQLRPGDRPPPPPARHHGPAGGHPAGLRGQLQHHDRVPPGRGHQALPETGHRPLLRHQDRHRQFRTARDRGRRPGLPLPLRLYPPRPGAESRITRNSTSPC